MCCLDWGQLVETVVQYYLTLKIAWHMTAANENSPLPELRYSVCWFRHSLCGLGLHLARWFRAGFPVRRTTIVIKTGIKIMETFTGFSIAEAVAEIKSIMIHQTFISDFEVILYHCKTLQFWQQSECLNVLPIHIQLLDYICVSFSVSVVGGRFLFFLLPIWINPNL